MSRFVCAYRYVDESGALLFEVVRWEPKNFSQRQPDGQGGWKRKRDRDGKLRLTMDGCRMVVYRLDRLVAARAEMVENGVVPLALILEGEKDCDRAARGGMLATTVPGGAGKWCPEFAQYFKDFDLALIPHNDKPGRDHMHTISRSVLPVAASVKLVDLGLPEPKADFSDWADRGHTRAELKALIAATPMLSVADLPPLPAAQNRPAEAVPDRTSAYAWAALDRACKAIREAPDGAQQRTLNREAFGIGQLCVSGQLPEGEALSRLHSAAADMPSYNPRRPWRTVRLERMTKRAFDAGLNQPRDIPQPRERRYG